MNEIEAYENLKSWLFDSYNERLKDYLISKSLNDQEKGSYLYALYVLQDIIEKNELEDEWYAWQKNYYKSVKLFGKLSEIHKKCLAWRFEYMKNEYPKAYEYPEYPETY